MSPRYGAVILAAGEGSRMGRRPKSLLLRDGVPLIRHQLAALQQAGIVELVVVLGHYREPIEAALNGLSIQVVSPHQPSDTQRQSICLGLQALPRSLDGVLVCPSDMPLLNVDDYRELVAAYEARQPPVQFVGPEVDGQPGNPVIFDGEVRRTIESGEGRFGCGNWRRHRGESVQHWPSDNRHYITDLDTEADIEQLQREYGITLRWPDGV